MMSRFLPNSGPDEWKKYLDNLGDIIPDLNTPEGLEKFEEYLLMNPIEDKKTKNGAWLYKNYEGDWCKAERRKG